DLFHKVYQNLVFKTIKVDFPDCYRAPKGKKYPEYAFECLEKYEEILKKQSNSIAALVVEPIVQGAAGMIMWPKGILKRMAQLSKEYNVIFIADEVATGFGRTGKMFACEHEDVVPDIMCLAKGITGGYLPLAATMTSKKIYDGFLYNYEELKTFFHGHTYTGNPLCCAAGLANLKIFQKERVLEKLQPKIIHLAKRLKMFYNLCSVGDVRQRGFMVGIELVKSTQTQKGFDWQDRIGVKVCELARSRGVILRPLGNVIVLIPPLSMSIKEIDQMINVAYWAVSEIEK
ncbi:Adenosylmethionine-8-amino-7-oxononanoate aminotransferase, partial [hydrothermal vent metagenome]